MLAESNIIYETFGINVVPAYMDIAEIPTLHEASDEQDKQSKQQLLKFCHTLLRTRHQQLYMHIDHIEHATASTILYEVNNISKKFLSKAVENIESVKKEVQENDEYEAIRDMEEEKLKPYLLAVAVKMAKFVDLPEFKIEINLDETVTAEQYLPSYTR